MKNRFLGILLSFSLICLASGCVNEQVENNGSTGDSDKVIQFSVAPSTRTAYDPNAPLQINWEDGDEIAIYCADAYGELKQANYIVRTPNPSSPSSSGTITPSDPTAQLKWGSDDVHTFYAVYPASAPISIGPDGKIVLPAVHSQYVDLNESAGLHATTPRTSEYAYMVAKAEVSPSAGSVVLDFEPIMTTLEIIVKGRSQNQADAIVTGLTLGMQLPKDSPTTRFTYNASGEVGFLEYVGTSAETKNETIFVGIKGPAASGQNETGQDYVTLKPNETVSITAFVPPLDIKSGDVKIRVHGTGNTEISTTLRADIAPKSKRIIKLHNLPAPPTNEGANNWLTLLNDDIYVSQLSIPGSHDSATGDGTTFSLGKTQDMTLDKQFEMGIRAFDLRPTVSNNDIIIAHGAVATNYNWDDIMLRFKTYLERNPGEFIIIFMRHEDEYDGGSSAWGGLMIEKLNAIKAAINPSTRESYTIDFRPDLTIGDMRGKILFLCRDWTKYNDAGPLVGGYTGWSHGPNGAEVKIYGIDGPEGILNHQDCYAPSESGDWKGLITGSIANNSTNRPLVQNFPTVKWNIISSQLDKSMTFHTLPQMINRWSLNHTSGYVGGSVLGVYNSVSTTDGYRNNARNNHIKFYNKITGVDWKGSTGIILSDFVGVRSSGGIDVYGDLLPQAIIDNNYKYRMKRKNE